MNMDIIQSAAFEMLVNVALAVLALAGAYAVYYIRLGASKLKAQTAQIEDASTRKVLDDALKDVENLATLSVSAMEQTTAKALREAVKGGKASRDELVALGKQVFDEVKASIAPEAQRVITKNLGSFDEYYDLMVIRISEGEASFNSEIQNDPIDPENCTFQEEWFDFWDDEGKAQPDFSDPKFLFVGANDPSLGKNKKSDTSSIIALAKDTQTGYLYVVIADIAKRKPDQIIEDALDASRRLQREYKRPYYKFGVETVQFQYYFAEIMRQRAAAVGEYLPTATSPRS